MEATNCTAVGMQSTFDQHLLNAGCRAPNGKISPSLPISLSNSLHLYLFLSFSPPYRVESSTPIPPPHSPRPTPRTALLTSPPPQSSSPPRPPASTTDLARYASCRSVLHSLRFPALLPSPQARAYTAQFEDRSLRAAAAGRDEKNGTSAKNNQDLRPCQVLRTLAGFVPFPTHIHTHTPKATLPSDRIFGPGHIKFSIHTTARSVAKIAKSRRLREIDAEVLATPSD